MKNDYFRQIVSTQKYECQGNKKIVIQKIKKKISPDFQKETEVAQKIKYEKRSYSWENTNFMLREPGYCGLKTGITEAAGPCCSVAYQKDGHSLIIILLSCESMERRWEEVPILVDWATNL